MRLVIQETQTLENVGLAANVRNLGGKRTVMVTVFANRKDKQLFVHAIRDSLMMVSFNVHVALTPFSNFLIVHQEPGF